jgi:hypothetical protein
MNEHKDQPYTPSFTREFCNRLEWHLGATFETAGDKKIRGLWCDGVMPPFFDNELTQKSVNDTRKIITTAFIGYGGEHVFEMTIRLGKYALRRYAKGTSMIDCIPGKESMDWITLDVENRKIEVRLK